MNLLIDSNNKTRESIATVLFLLVYLLLSPWLNVPVVMLYNEFAHYSFGPVPSASIMWDLYANPLQCYLLLLESKIFFQWIIFTVMILAVMIMIFYIIKYSSPSQVGIQYLKENGTNGTAGWQEIEETEKVLGVGTFDGVIFGTIGTGFLKLFKKVVTLPKVTFFNRNIAVFGASGSGKSRSFVRTNILQIASKGEEHSMVITDPKGELAQDMAPFLRKRGYDVKIFNLVQMLHSDRWNPLSEVKDDLDAQTFTQVVIANTQASEKAGGDQFWDRAEQNLLKALALYVVIGDTYPKEKKNIQSVYELLSCGDSSMIDATFEALPNSHPAKMPYNIYRQASETVRTGVVIGLGTRLQVFQNKIVQALTAESDIDLTMPGRKKCAYFCISPDTDSTFDFLAGLFFSFLFIKLTRYADRRGGKGEKDVVFILDEFPNIAEIPDFKKKISTMRSRGLHSIVIFQNIAQLQNRYPNGAHEEIIGNCDSRLCLGCTDITTAKFVSELIGTATVQAIGSTRQGGLEGLFDFGTIKESTQERNLLNPDEILRLPNENAILVLRGQKPLLINKMVYTEHKLSKYIRPNPLRNYKPQWAEIFKQENNIVEEDEDATSLDPSLYESNNTSSIDTSKLSNSMKEIYETEIPDSNKDTDGDEDEYVLETIGTVEQAMGLGDTVSTEENLYEKNNTENNPLEKTSYIPKDETNIDTEASSNTDNNISVVVPKRNNITQPNIFGEEVPVESLNNKKRERKSPNKPQEQKKGSITSADSKTKVTDPINDGFFG